MIESLVAALLLLTAGLCYLAGLLKERSVRVGELQTLLAQTHLEKRAYQNQLLVKQGSPPIFTQDGAVRLDHVPDDVSVTQILRPPFAQAELDWENEDQKPMTVAETIGAFVPDLSDEQKRAMTDKYNRNGS